MALDELMGNCLCGEEESDWGILAVSLRATVRHVPRCDWACMRACKFRAFYVLCRSDALGRKDALVSISMTSTMKSIPPSRRPWRML